MDLSDNHKWSLIRLNISLQPLAELLIEPDRLSYYDETLCLWTNDSNLPENR